MNLRHGFNGCLVVATVTLAAYFGTGRPVAAQQAQAVTEDGVEVLTRGPVHEAFAETVTFDPQPGIVAPKAPPEAIEEVPPDQRPAGDNVTWIPGYWAWDDDREDFLWVSGIWRALPPGRQWVPGYWGQAGQEFQWTSGYWANAKLTESELLPEPPATVEAGPNRDAPSADHIWIPGSWVWNQNRYAWRPGYWATAQENWVWVPAHHVWSPRGYVFVDGYYDYSVARRGVLFAPVHFAPAVYAQRGFTYSPSIVISTAVFGNQLFLRPNYNHYYFGDYYGSTYASAGFVPWFAFQSGGQGYDPFYAHQHWQNRQNPAWDKSVQTTFQYRVDHEAARPPRTLADQQALLKTGDAATDKSLVLATPLNELAKAKDSPVRLQAVTQEEQHTLAKRGQEVERLRGERQKLEVTPTETSAAKPAKPLEPAKLQLPKSPIVAKSSDQLGEDHTPPKLHEAPRADPKVEPKPRSALVKGEPTKGSSKVRTAQPKADAASKVEPKAAAKVEPKPAPKVEPKPAASGEPKPVPKAEPKPTPKAEPKPAPRAEPKPAPRAEPQPGRPKAEPKGGKEKDQPKS